jgi:hypothetical protein
MNAQDNTMSKQGSSMSKGNQVSATGCVKQGTSPDGYYLKADDGKTYELWGYKALSKHVNHKVTVTGVEEKMSAAKEKAKEANEKTEAGGGEQTDLKVTHLKMVSENCQ